MTLWIDQYGTSRAGFLSITLVTPWARSLPSLDDLMGIDYQVKPWMTTLVQVWEPQSPREMTAYQWTSRSMTPGDAASLAHDMRERTGAGEHITCMQITHGIPSPVRLDQITNLCEVSRADLQRFTKALAQQLQEISSRNVAILDVEDRSRLATIAARRDATDRRWCFEHSHLWKASTPGRSRSCLEPAVYPLPCQNNR